MPDFADRASEQEEAARQAALAHRRQPQFRGNQICNECTGPNDRPEYAICSTCLAYKRKWHEDTPPLRRCGDCRHFQPEPEAAFDREGVCVQGVTKLLMAGRPTPITLCAQHHCNKWEPAE